MRNPFRYFKTSPEVIRLAVMMYVRFPLSLRQVEDMRRSYIRDVAGASTADELAKLAELKDKGVITDEELQAQKAKLLGQGPAGQTATD